jgi:hypothetical protein
MKTISLQTYTVFFHRAFKMVVRQTRSPDPCPIESNALRLLAPPWPFSAAVLPIRTEGRRTTAATTDMAADPRWFNPKYRLALAVLPARHITISAVATAQATTASRTGTITGARTAARMRGPAKADRVTRHHREARLADRLTAARRAGARAAPHRRPATMADSRAAGYGYGQYSNQH